MNPTLSFELSPVDGRSFTGKAHSGLIAGSGGEAPTRIYWVRFEPGARTHWHRHSGTQILLIQEGRCLVQRDGGSIEVHPEGSTVRFSPGERHWHGAPPDAPMVHVAINLENADTEWQEPATGEAPTPPGMEPDGTPEV